MRVLLIVAVAWLGVARVGAQDDADTAAAYHRLLKDFSAAGGAFRASENDSQRVEAVERFAAYPRLFAEFAEQHPGQPETLPALRQGVQAVNSVDSLTQQAWELNRDAFHSAADGDAARRVAAILRRDYLDSDQLAPIRDRMRYWVRREFETFLDDVLASNPHREVQGIACLALAQILRNQLNAADRASLRTDWIARYESMLGKEYFTSIRGSGRKSVEARVEELYEQAIQYSDVDNFSFSDSIAEKARSELFEIRNLVIGKQAPEIEGEDQDGRRLKLSDYRGKVVLLYFWMEY